jgi:hypothetical protein
MPLEVELERYEGVSHPFLFVRTWRAEDVGRCSLCPACGAAGKAGDVATCIRYPAEMPSEEDAPLFRTNWGDFPFDR